MTAEDTVIKFRSPWSVVDVRRELLISSQMFGVWVAVRGSRSPKVALAGTREQSRLSPTGRLSNTICGSSAT